MPVLDRKVNINENDSYCNSRREEYMYICVCNAITDREIRQAAELGATSIEHLKDSLGVATCCGTCESCAVEILQQEASACGSRKRARQYA